MLHCSVQRMERLRLPKLPFAGQRRSQKRHRRHGAKRGGGKVTRPLAAVQGMKAWVKSQAVMLYGVEHDELWVHEGFCEVRRTPPVLPARLTCPLLQRLHLLMVHLCMSHR